MSDLDVDRRRIRAEHEAGRITEAERDLRLADVDRREAAAARGEEAIRRAAAAMEQATAEGEARRPFARRVYDGPQIRRLE